MFQSNTLFVVRTLMFFLRKTCLEVDFMIIGFEDSYVFKMLPDSEL